MKHHLRLTSRRLFQRYAMHDPFHARQHRWIAGIGSLIVFGSWMDFGTHWANSFPWPQSFAWAVVVLLIGLALTIAFAQWHRRIELSSYVRYRTRGFSSPATPAMDNLS